MFNVTTLKHNIIYKKCLVIFNKSCLKRLKLSALVKIFFSTLFYCKREQFQNILKIVTFYNNL